MSWYYVNYSCGHEARVQLGGTDKERARKIEWYEMYGLYPECHKRQFKKKGELNWQDYE